VTPGAHGGSFPVREHSPVEDHPQHVLTERPTAHGVEVTCSCGDFDGWYNGPRSRRYVLHDHDRHVRDAGPVTVQSTRADQEEEQP
jgi:hypothetical protein